MWIERLDIQGYRGISGEFDFSPGLNLVVGENEAGKSTLHDALVRSMFGFGATERRRYRGTSVRDECRPWDGRPFGLVASVRDAHGHDYRIEWDFDGHTVRLLDGATDRSAEVRLRNDDVGLGEFLLDIGLEDFRQICCIDQVAVEAVRTSATLGLALQEAVAQIGGDVAAQDVVARLDGFLRDSIGARVDTLAPTARGRLGSLIAERSLTEQRLEEDSSAREQIAGLARDLELNRVEQGAMTVSIETTRQQLLISEREELASEVDEARRLSSIAAKRVEVPDAPPQPAVDAIRAADIRLAQLADNAVGIEAEIERNDDEVKALEKRERVLDGQLTEVESYADIDVSSRAAVQQASADLDALRATTVSAPDEPPAPDPLLARYRAERSALFALGAGAGRWTTRRVLWTVLVVASMGIALLVRRVIRRFRDAQPTLSELDLRLAEYGASSLEALDARVAEEDRRLAAAHARADVALKQAAERESRVEDLEQSLLEALDEADAVPAATLGARAKAYLAACEKHAQRIGLQLEQERIRSDLQRLRQPKSALRELVSEQTALERELRERYVRLGIAADNLESARVALEALLDAVTEAKAATRDADGAAQALTAVLGGGTEEELEGRAAEAVRVHREHVDRFGTLAISRGETASVKRDLSELMDEAGHTRDRVTELQTRIGDLEDGLGSRAELEERLAELVTQIAGLERAKEAIRIAREVIRGAADELNREFQPFLREALKQTLPRITGGRYSDVEVDGDLQVQVVVPGFARQVSAEQLSRATRDQIFLVQRLEIARLLAPAKGAAPLILDDPFAHYDEKRLRFGLELLTEIARERQVLIFSENASLPALAIQVCSECYVIELPQPGS